MRWNPCQSTDNMLTYRFHHFTGIGCVAQYSQPTNGGDYSTSKAITTSTRDPKHRLVDINDVSKDVSVEKIFMTT